MSFQRKSHSCSLENRPPCVDQLKAQSMYSTDFPPIQPEGEVMPSGPTSERVAILEEAMRIVSQDRNVTYGAPEDNFATIAAFWETWLNARYSGGLGITPVDVAAMCVLLKVARLARTPNHRDSAVDIAGYAACLGEIQSMMR